MRGEVQGAAPVVAPAPGSVVVQCEPFRATLSLRACLWRVTALWPSGGRAGHPRVPECARCPLGLERLEAAPWYIPPPPSQPAEVLPPEQRAARARWLRSFAGDYSAPSHARADGGEAGGRGPALPGEDAGEDPLRVAAELTPSDPGIVADVG
jgi:hypothetical protein